MKLQPVRLAAALALGTVTALAGAADDAASARAQLEQRLKLTESLLADSATAQRIQASGNAGAVAALDGSRVRQALARDLLAKGDLTGARREVDEALKLLGQARRLVPDVSARQAAAKLRYEQMDAALERLIEAWKTRSGTAISNDGDYVFAMGLIQTARAQAKESRHEDAVHALTSAEGHVLNGMNRVMHAATIDYTARATTPAEEYQQESARLTSLTELVPLAVKDLRPRPEAVALIDRYLEASAALRVQAQQQQQAGNTAEAVNHLRNAILYVQRALTTAGLVIPQAVGGNP